MLQPFYLLDINHKLHYNYWQVVLWQGGKKMTPLKEHKKYSGETIIVLILIIIQAVYISVFFGINKQGYHSDELWNYGFANSSEGIHIYTNNGKDVKNCLEWTDSKKLLEYVSVDKSEIFSYGAIYKNAAMDLNPPLQYMLLHLICSFFPNMWSKWFCFIINIFAFILTQIYLFKLSKEVTHNTVASISALLLYGFSIGIINISSFLRIYALGVAFVMMFFYYSYMVFDSRKSPDKQKKYILKSAISCLLGALTVHLFLSIAFIIVFMFSVYYLFSKNIKLLFKYGLSMTLAVGMSILIFPSSIFHLFGNSETLEMQKYPTSWQFKIYWSFLSKDISGLHNSAIPTMTATYVLLGIFAIIFLTIPVCFIARNEKWFKNAVNKVKEKCSYIKSNIKNFPYVIIVLIVSVNFFILMDAMHSSVFRMGIFSRRYLFLIYPLYSALVTYLIYYLFKFFISNKKLLYTAIVGMSLVCTSLTHVFSCDYFSLKNEKTGVTFDDIEKDANCIICLTEIWVLTNATIELYDTNSFYATQINTCIQDNYDIGLDTGKPLYLILDATNLTDYESDEDIDTSGNMIQYINERDQAAVYSNHKKEILDYYENLSISTKLELVGTDYLYDRYIEIYRLN